MSKVERRNFNIKMHLACGTDALRPVLNMVYFDNGYMVATNAHFLVKARLDQFTAFDAEEIARLNGKFLDRDTFKKLYACKVVRVVEDGIEDAFTGTIYKWFKLDAKYPNYQAVIPTDPATPLNSISVDPRLMKQLCTVVGYDNINSIELRFHGETKAIKIHCNMQHEDSLVAILMPCKKAA